MYLHLVSCFYYATKLQMEPVHQILTARSLILLPNYSVMHLRTPLTLSYISFYAACPGEGRVYRAIASLPWNDSEGTGGINQDRFSFSFDASVIESQRVRWFSGE